MLHCAQFVALAPCFCCSFLSVHICDLWPLLNCANKLVENCVFPIFCLLLPPFRFLSISDNLNYFPFPCPSLMLLVERVSSASNQWFVLLRFYVQTSC